MYLSILVVRSRPIAAKDVISICKTKNLGFTLTLSSHNDISAMPIEDYIQVVKNCPKSVVMIRDIAKSRKLKFE